MNRPLPKAMRKRAKQVSGRSQEMLSEVERMGMERIT